MDRRKALRFALATVVTAALPSRAQFSSPLVEVWRSPECGCCGAWIRHLQLNGFTTRVHLVDDTSAARKAAGIPAALASCHTGKVYGYALEGHVPAADIRRLLAQKPAAVGLAVPGMPVGSPGMEHGDSRQPFETLLVLADGSTTVFERHR